MTTHLPYYPHCSLPNPRSSVPGCINLHYQAAAPAATDIDINVSIEDPRSRGNLSRKYVNTIFDLSVRLSSAAGGLERSIFKTHQTRVHRPGQLTPSHSHSLNEALTSEPDVFFQTLSNHWAVTSETDVLNFTSPKIALKCVMHPT